MPGMLALGPVKALQLLQKRKSQLIDKSTNPPMVALRLPQESARLFFRDITHISIRLLVRMVCIRLSG